MVLNSLRRQQILDLALLRISMLLRSIQSYIQPPPSATPFAGYFTNGYLAEYNFVDGSQLGPENFGETDTDTGAWIPKKYVGTYGTNGFYLDFSDNSSLSALGTDSSGNGNNWTPVSFSVTAGVDNDSLEDTPTNNWCTLNPLDTDPARTSTVAISNGNLDASVNTYSSVQYVMRTATFASNGKDYFEVRKGDSVSKAVLMGFLEEDGPRSGSTAYAQAYVYSSGNNSTTNSGRVFNTTSATTGYPSTDPGSLGDVIMICHDRANKKIWFGKNGTWFTTGGVVGDPATGTAPAITYTTDKVLLPCIAAASFANTTIRNVNFGQRPFDYTPPTGFEALNAANLPVPTIKNGTEYFTPVLYTGNATARDITVADNQDVAWQPDWVWIKGRPTTSSHTLYDVVRGATKLLSSHNTNAESTDTDTLTSFNTDGFSIGTDVKVNTNSDNYVAWNWKAGGAASTPTQGTIASTASVNAEAGFSIVSYTGNGTAGATIGHGLGVAPSMVIVKNRDRATDWSVWAEPVVDQYGAAYAVFLQATSNAGSYPGVFNSTAPTSTVFSVGTSSSTNFSSEDYIAFCFSEVKSYLKIGKYTGNGSSDGPFVECGFRPSWVMIKRIDNVGNWEIMDNKRLGYNDDNYALRADLGNGEVAKVLIFCRTVLKSVKTVD